MADPSEWERLSLVVRQACQIGPDSMGGAIPFATLEYLLNTYPRDASIPHPRLVDVCAWPTTLSRGFTLSEQALTATRQVAEITQRAWGEATLADVTVARVDSWLARLAINPDGSHKKHDQTMSLLLGYVSTGLFFYMVHQTTGGEPLVGYVNSVIPQWTASGILAGSDDNRQYRFDPNVPTTWDAVWHPGSVPGVVTNGETMLLIDGVRSGAAKGQRFLRAHGKGGGTGTVAADLPDIKASRLILSTAHVYLAPVAPPCRVAWGTARANIAGVRKLRRTGMLAKAELTFVDGSSAKVLLPSANNLAGLLALLSP